MGNAEYMGPFEKTPSHTQYCSKQLQKTSRCSDSLFSLFWLLLTCSPRLLQVEAIITRRPKKPAPAPAPATRTADPGNLVEVAQKLDGFKTLVGLVVELGLVETLSSVEAATVFAPTDDAFAKVAAVLPTLTTEEKTAIVARHVIARKTVKAADVPTASIGTYGGENIDLVKDDAGVGVSYNGGARSNVIIADVVASNGVIHAIDSVIL